MRFDIRRLCRLFFIPRWIVISDFKKCYIFFCAAKKIFFTFFDFCVIILLNIFALQKNNDSKDVIL
jgi:hypothetical protein